MYHREIEYIKQYIYDNYDKELGVEQLADKVSLAPSYLSHIFKKETGQNLSKFIKAYRMEMAKKMLEEKKMRFTTELPARVEMTVRENDEKQFVFLFNNDKKEKRFVSII